MATEALREFALRKSEGETRERHVAPPVTRATVPNLPTSPFTGYGSHSVYAVELDPDVLGRRKFREANPDYLPGMPCVYVGLTGLTPEERLLNHTSGYKASRYVRDFGIDLLPDLYEHLNPLPFEEAERMEEVLALVLRKAGYAVWSW